MLPSSLSVGGICDPVSAGRAERGGPLEVGWSLVDYTGTVLGLPVCRREIRKANSRRLIVEHPVRRDILPHRHVRERSDRDAHYGSHPGGQNSINPSRRACLVRLFLSEVIFATTVVPELFASWADTAFAS